MLHFRSNSVFIIVDNKKVHKTRDPNGLLKSKLTNAYP